MIRRLIIPLAAAAALAPAAAAAHTPAVADNCHGLNVTLTNYEGATPNNRVTVTIDGATQTFDYGTSFARSFTWSPTAAHTWTVVVDANRVHGHPTEWDRTFNGTEQPCQTTTSSSTTTSTSTTSTQPPTSTTTIPDTTTTATAQSSTTSLPASSTSTTPTTQATPPSSVVSPSTTPSGPAGLTSPTAPPEALDALPVTGSTIDPWIPLAIILFAAYLLLAARKPRTP